MKHLLLATITAAALMAAAPAIGGRWSMAVDAGPHGNAAMGLTLHQDGSKVTGTFSSPHGDLPVAGEFADGQLKIATTEGKEDDRIYLQARLHEDGTLAGVMSSPMGDMKWTATRTKDKDDK
jgi:opacity protein-like surface antigen